MTASPPSSTLSLRGFRRADLIARAPEILAGVAFAVLFAQPFATLVRDWWNDPDAGHGLLLFPVALYLAWRRGRHPAARPQPILGMGLLLGALLVRYLSGLAAELFTMRFSMLGAAAALVVFTLGVRQLLHWWLPTVLLALSIPLPAVVTGTLALPLQLKASQLGAWLLESRDVPVKLAGNVIHLPGRSLFVTEACSGLRSLTALLALGLLTGGMWLRSPWSRAALVAAAIPVAIMLNGVRIFLTGFFVQYVNPKLADGFMHYTEGWVIFVVAFLILGAATWGLYRLERRLARPAAAVSQ
jgi:exosortase